jgi:hypothetical protein
LEWRVTAAAVAEEREQAGEQVLGLAFAFAFAFLACHDSRGDVMRQWCGVGKLVWCESKVIYFRLLDWSIRV